MKAFKKLKVADSELAKVQENVSVAIAPLQASQVVDGILIKNQRLLTGAATEVLHGLGRELIGWQVVGQNANAQLWDEQAANPLKSKTLRLQTSADVTVNLWVF